MAERSDALYGAHVLTYHQAMAAYNASFCPEQYKSPITIKKHATVQFALSGPEGIRGDVLFGKVASLEELKLATKLCKDEQLMCSEIDRRLSVFRGDGTQHVRPTMWQNVLV